MQDPVLVLVNSVCHFTVSIKMAKKSHRSSHELVYTIASSLTGISVVVNKNGRDFSTIEKKRNRVERSSSAFLRVVRHRPHI